MRIRLVAVAALCSCSLLFTACSNSDQAPVATASPSEFASSAPAASASNSASSTETTAPSSQASGNQAPDGQGSGAQTPAPGYKGAAASGNNPETPAPPYVPFVKDLQSEQQFTDLTHGFFAAYRYALQTGDVRLMGQESSAECASCTQWQQQLIAAHQSGWFASDPRFTFNSLKTEVSPDAETVIVKANVTQSAFEMQRRSGEKVDSPAITFDAVLTYVKTPYGYKLQSITPVPTLVQLLK